MLFLMTEYESFQIIVNSILSFAIHEIEYQLEQKIPFQDTQQLLLIDIEGGVRLLDYLITYFQLALLIQEYFEDHYGFAVDSKIVQIADGKPARLTYGHYIEIRNDIIFTIILYKVYYYLLQIDMQSQNNQYLKFVGKPLITVVIVGEEQIIHLKIKVNLLKNMMQFIQLINIISIIMNQLVLFNNKFIIARKWKKVSNIKESQWNYEVGEAPIDQQSELKLSNAKPIFVRKDTSQHFQYRVRNLNYPQDVYQVEVDENSQEIVIRKSNKKYFKRFAIPDMK